MALPRVVPLAAGVLAAVLALGTTGAAYAAPQPSERRLRAQLADLNKQVDRLIADYNAKRVELAKARRAEKAARDRLAKAQHNYDTVRQAIEDFAGLRYQTGSALLMPDPASATVVYQLQQEQVLTLATFDQIRAERQQAAEAAEAVTKSISDQAAAVAAQRAKAEDLIDTIKEKLDQLIPIAPGKRPGGLWAPELPGGPDNITPRTRLMRAEVSEHFTLRYPVGCYRYDTIGEHPLGRACDFMMSSGGAMPTPEMRALGDEIAAWAIKNGHKLGVMYVIWRQRIYRLDRPGWRTMSDRGGVTANHYDHVHISMY